MYIDACTFAIYSKHATIKSLSLKQMSVEKRVDELIEKNAVMIFSKSYCPHCSRAKSLLESAKITFAHVELDTDPEGSAMHEYLKKKTNFKTVPNIFLKQQHVGGCDDLMALQKSGKLTV